MKTERRRAASLERELDQLKFSMEATTRENNELLVGLRSQLSHLEAENASLSGRFQKSIQESKKKFDVERAEHRNTKEKLREVLENEERMSIEVDNLRKKVQFFKANTYSRSSTCESKNEHRMSLIETSSIKKSLKYIFEKLRNFKMQHSKEKHQLLDEIKFYQSSICNTTDTLVVRIKEEAKKNKYQSKDIERLKSDLQKLQKINEEFSVKLVSHRSLSKMTTVELSSNAAFETMRTFDDKEGKSNMEEGENGRSMGRYSVTDRKHGYDEAKRRTIGGLGMSSIKSSNSVQFQSNFLKGSMAQKDYSTIERDSVTFQERLSNLRNSETEMHKNLSSQNFQKQRGSLVPKLSFKENQENMNVPKQYMNSYRSVRLLSQRIEDKGNVLAERALTGSNNWRESLAKRDRKSYYGDREFVKDSKENYGHRDTFDSRNHKFGILREISEVNSINNKRE